MSIKTKLTISTIAVFLLMVIIIGFVFSSVMKSTLTSEAKYDAGQLCHETAYSLEKSLMSDMRIIRTLASGGITRGSAEELLPVLQNSVRISKYEYIALQWNGAWYMVTSDKYEDIPDPTGISQEIFSSLLLGYLFDGEKEGVLIVEQLSAGNDVAGKLVAKRSMDWLSSVVTQGNSKPNTSLILSKQNGQIIYPEGIGLTVSEGTNTPDGTIVVNGIDQSIYNGIKVDLKNAPVSVSAYVDPNVIENNLSRYVQSYILFAFCGLVFISCIVYASCFLLTRSIISLAKYTEQADVLGERMPARFTRRKDEAGVLARSFALLMNKVSGSLGKMKHMAYHDNLTGLKNRYSLEQDIEKMIRDKKPFAFALMDIDDFKIINDMMGHAEGDRLLICIARIFESLISETMDAYRWGGDEFAFILSGGSKDSYKKDIEKVLSEVSVRFDSNNKWRISVSAGLCLFPDSASDYQRMLVLADQALIFSKRSGKARYRFYEDI